MGLLSLVAHRALPSLGLEPHEDPSIIPTWYLTSCSCWGGGGCGRGDEAGALGSVGD